MPPPLDVAYVRDPEDAARGAAARSNRFGSPLNLARVHWVRPELVTYQGLREE
jgi:hypothetical protein